MSFHFVILQFPGVLQYFEIDKKIVLSKNKNATWETKIGEIKYEEITIAFRKKNAVSE